MVGRDGHHDDGLSQTPSDSRGPAGAAIDLYKKLLKSLKLQTEVQNCTTESD